MKKVKIIKSWKDSVMDQSPGGKGVWGGSKFNEKYIKNENTSYDVVAILGDVRNKTRLKVGDENVFLCVMEPPTNTPKWVSANLNNYKYIITNDENLSGRRIVHDHWPIVWKINKTYDELSSNIVPKKTKEISWVTSNKDYLEGHKNRIKYLNHVIKLGLKFDLFGKGYKEIEDKWDAIAPYKYSIAIENFSGEYYWSEKIADCFLSWSMPIYYGCTNIDKYFPKNSYIQVDINDVEKSIYVIEEAIQNNLWSKNIDSIREARELVLNKYQLFPYLSKLSNDIEPVKEYKYIDVHPGSFQNKKSLKNYLYNIKIIRNVFNNEK